MRLLVNISKLFLALLLVLFSCSASTESKVQNKEENSQLVPAFPGAMGGGMYTTGGRGGKVIKVTNLNDSGPGSLREAIQQDGARTILFDVSGTIELESPLHIENDNLTVAGQSAPGDGICIKGHEVRIYANNIIIRFIRFRLGDIAGKEYDALTGMGNKNIIVDHCSMSWSTDETVSLYDNENFTLQWSIISESLNNSVHRKGPHGYGGIWGGKNATFAFNILAHHSSRNPRLQGTRYRLKDGQEKTEIINNMVYNWGNKAIYGGENGIYNIINNIFIPGPASPKSKVAEILEPYKPYGSYYLQGNEVWVSGEKIISSHENVSLPSNKHRIHLVSNQNQFLINTMAFEAQDAYGLMISKAGASLVRDAVDQRIINEITNRSFTYGNMGIIDSQNDTEGWPALKSLPPLLDSDGDGIPDEWETKHGLNPFDPTDGNKFSLNSLYTNLEVYLNEIVSNKFESLTN